MKKDRMLEARRQTLSPIKLTQNQQFTKPNPIKNLLEKYVRLAGREKGFKSLYPSCLMKNHGLNRPDSAFAGVSPAGGKQNGSGPTAGFSVRGKIGLKQRPMNSRFPGLSLISLVFLSACSWNNKPAVNGPEEGPQATNRCIKHRFVQGHADHLYGMDCVEGKHLLVRTTKEGERVSTSHAISPDNTEGLRLEEEMDFINKVYNPGYTLLEGRGDDKKHNFLKSLLPVDRRFFGSLDTLYRIVFETRGPRLVLYKASENKNDLPYTERTSLVTSKDGKWLMTPFVHYPIEYCIAVVKTNIQGQATYENRIKCQQSSQRIVNDYTGQLQPAQYIRLHSGVKADDYKYVKKKDLFPAAYWTGRWFFSEGAVETSSREGHIAPRRASLVELRKTSDSLEIIDVSGDIEERLRRRIGAIPVKWMKYKIDQTKSSLFQETPDEDGSAVTNRPYLQIDFPELIAAENAGSEVADILVAKDYFSFIIKRSTDSSRIKHKFSLLRENAVDTADFIPRRWFQDVHDHFFGTLTIQPQDVKKLGEHTREDFSESVRMIHFNTNRDKTVIEWHFSNYSTKDPEYRALGEEAVRIYNRAFQIITQGSSKKIEVRMGEGDKELGDLRYNIINMIDTQDLVGWGGLYGYAPSYVHSNTGQIIGTTSNVFLQNMIETATDRVRDYIRYQIFQKEKNTREENAFHVVSPHIRAQIQKKCPWVRRFISRRAKARNLRPGDILGDKKEIVSCAREISKPVVLYILLHEMGHSFGLAHNFRASIDSDNYYQSAEDLKKYFPEVSAVAGELSKTSSVMDYYPSVAVQPRELGKYDLAALRFLYLGQVERADRPGRFLSLDIPADPKKQSSPLVALSRMKKYLHCSHEDIDSIKLLCLLWDYGSTPLEIVNFDIEKYKRGFNHSRYRYDSDSLSAARGIDMPGESAPPLATEGKAKQLSATGSPAQECRVGSRRDARELKVPRTITFYNRWITLRNEYLGEGGMPKTVYALNDEASIEEYLRLIADGDGEEYKLFREVRKPVFDFFITQPFLKTLQCRVKEADSGKERAVNFEKIKERIISQIPDEEDLYAEDCHSEGIVRFLEANGLILTGQTGFENFDYYYYRSKTQQNEADVQSLLNTLNPLGFDWDILTAEPDFFKAVKDKINTELLSSEGKYKADFDRLKSQFNRLQIATGKNLHKAEYKDIVAQHIHDRKTVDFSTGIAAQKDVFHERVVEPLLYLEWIFGGKTPADLEHETLMMIEDMELPFLTTAYKTYHADAGSDYTVRGFRQFLIDMEQTIDETDTQSASWTVPFLPDSFSSRAIVQYNQNKKKVRLLNDKEKTEGLTFLETVERESLKEHNEVLRDLLLSSPFRNSGIYNPILAMFGPEITNRTRKSRSSSKFHPQ